MSEASVKISGGRVIDPANQIDDLLDVFIVDGSIAAVGVAPDGFRLFLQSGADLGERLANALAHHLQQGYRKAVIMNSDGPTLPLAYLEEAFTGLDHGVWF